MHYLAIKQFVIEQVPPLVVIVLACYVVNY